MAGRSEDASGGTGFFKGMIQSASDLQATKAIQAQTQQVTQVVGGHVREVLGPLAEASDFMKATFENSKDFFKGLSEDVAGVFGMTVGESKWESKMRKQGKEQVDETERTNTILLMMVSQRRKERLAQMRDVGKKAAGTWLSLILGIPVLLMGIIAGFVSGRMKLIAGPFILAFDAIKITGGYIWRFIKTIKDFFAPEAKVGKAMTQLELFAKESWIVRLTKWFKSTKIGTIFMESVGRVSKIFQAIAKNRWIAGLGKSAKFVFGELGRLFKFITKLPFIGRVIRIGKDIGGKYLLPLITIFDFFSGLIKFKEIFGAQAGLKEAIIAGVGGIISGFFKIPAMAVDWLIKKLTGIDTDFASIFSIEQVALAIDGFLMFFKDMIDGIANFFKNIPTMLFGDTDFGEMWENIKKVPMDFVSMIGDAIQGISDFFSGIWGWFQEKVIIPVQDFLKAHPWIAKAVGAISPGVGLLAAAAPVGGGAPTAGEPTGRQMIRKPIDENAQKIRELERQRALLQMQAKSPALPEEMKQHAADQLQKLEHILTAIKKGSGGAIPVIAPGQGQTAQSMEPREDPPGAGMQVQNEAW